MTCTRYRESIHELVDGTLGPIRRAELEMHLDECASCRARADDLQAIHDTAASLEPLAPPDGVWLQIAGRLRQEGRVSAPAPVLPSNRRHYYAGLALAAALVLAVGASIALLVPQLRDARQAPAATTAQQPGNAAGDSTVESVEAEFRLAEQHYQNAIAKLEQATTLDKTSAEQNGIDPQTAAMLQKSLQVIDDAITESRAALKSDPTSAPARDSLFDALRRKVAVLQDTIALVNEMRKGNSAGASRLADGLNKS